MKYLWITIFSILCLCSYAQYSGTWFSDWQNQNQEFAYILPEYFVISEECNCIMYSTTPQIAIGNRTLSENQTFALITNPSSEDSEISFVDSNNVALTYNDTTDTFTLGFDAYAPTQGSFVQALYTRNGAYFSESLTSELLIGQWINPNQASFPIPFCVPESLLITKINPFGNFIASYTYKTLDCSLSLPQESLLRIESPSTEAIVWQTDSLPIMFDPTQPNQLTILEVAEYQKSQTTNLIEGKWQLDWQLNASYVRGWGLDTNIEITNVNNTYMNVTYWNAIQNGISDTLITSFIEIDGIYLDTTLGVPYSYDSATNSLMITTMNIVYSSNGSLFSIEPFIANNSVWVSDANATGENCCLPEGIRFMPGNSSNALNAYYYFPLEGQASCVTLEQDEPIIETLLNIGTPSIIQLNWVDGYGSEIAFANASTTSVITVQNFMGTGCSFEATIEDY